MSHLLRDHAPITDGAWAALQEEATTRLSTYLGARKLVDVSEPHGWARSAVSLGRVTPLPDPTDGVHGRQRRVLPLVETRASFEVSRAELDDAERGATDLDLDALDRAAHHMALAENRAVFHGWEEAGVTGITGATSHQPLPLGDVGGYPTSVARAVATLRGAGVDGPYGLAIGMAGYTGIIQTTERGGYLLLDHLRGILAGPVVWAPGVEGAVLISLRGGDFVLDLGQDLSLGYLTHDAGVITLYLEESFTFRVLEPDAAAVLTS